MDFPQNPTFPQKVRREHQKTPFFIIISTFGTLCGIFQILSITCERRRLVKVIFGPTLPKYTMQPFLFWDEQVVKDTIFRITAEQCTTSEA